MKSRSQEHKVLELLVCKGSGHELATKPSKQWGINHCRRCKKPWILWHNKTTNSMGPR